MRKLLLALLLFPAISFAQWVPNGNNPVTGSYTTYSFDGDQSVMGNTDLSKFRVGGWAAASGTLSGLLTGGDFYHRYWCHNVATNSTTGVISAVDKATSTSYCYGFTDNGLWTGFHAPVGATAVFNATAPISFNLLNGSISSGSQAIYGSQVITQLATVSGTPTGVASTTGGTMTATNNYAKIVVLDSAGMTVASTETANVPTSGTTASITWSWVEVPKAISYRIYVGTTSGAEGNYGTSTTNSFVQTANAGSGNVATSGSPQGYNNTGQVTVPGPLNANGGLYSTSIVQGKYYVGTPSGRAVNTGTTAIAIPQNTATSYLSGISASGVTITLAAPSGDGERRRIVFGGASTGITWAFTAPATAQVGLPTTVVAGQAIEIVYNSVAGSPANSAATTWYQY